MGDFLRCECPHCGQPVEYPPTGAGQSVPCPGCQRSLVLTTTPQPTPETGRFDLACQEFAGDPEFVKHPPTRDQIGRAWAWANFKNSHPATAPTHAELVDALKKLYPEFKKRPAER